MDRGHKVTFLTNKFAPGDNGRSGVRYMANGLKIYYLPLIPAIGGSVSFFSYWCVYPVVR